MKTTVDQKLYGLAARTAGVIRRDDVLAAGVSSSAIYRRTKAGVMEVAGTGVYILPELRNESTLLWAACLAVPGSVVSRTSAARLYGLPVPDDGRVHVTARKGTGRRMTGVVVHESRLPVAEDVEVHRGLPVTAPARTLFDLGGSLSAARFRFVLNHYTAHGGPDATEAFVACVLALGHRGVPGVQMMRSLLQTEVVGPSLEGSELEAMVSRGLAEHGLFGFIPERKPDWFDGIRGTVDFADPVARVILEADGRKWHVAEAAMASDRQRDRNASRHGWVVLRVTWHEVKHRPAATFGEIAAIVEARRAEAA